MFMPMTPKPSAASHLLEIVSRSGAATEAASTAKPADLPEGHGQRRIRFARIWSRLVRRALARGNQGLIHWLESLPLHARKTWLWVSNAIAMEL